jgi:hypothetical protein
MKRKRPGGLSHEASDDFQPGIPRLVRSHDGHAAVSFDGAGHPDRRKFVNRGFFGLRYGATAAVTKRGGEKQAALLLSEPCAALMQVIRKVHGHAPEARMGCLPRHSDSFFAGASAAPTRSRCDPFF